MLPMLPTICPLTRSSAKSSAEIEIKPIGLVPFSWKVLEKKNWLNSAGVVVPLMLGAHTQWAAGIEERSEVQPPVLCP